ncbi:ABC transporter substrate-binding protein [Litchfieldella qijiaojingensis]|uniref:ABC transporter substrate-binding protein n=1 Tax=Litchfieldella qijiaojingensis TaxID=980347 RepID=A0ABQ2YMR7_9GAMM|nr:ABC transporter substrate-binding protein [Halomonas qijiaojingensis]
MLAVAALLFAVVLVVVVRPGPSDSPPRSAVSSEQGDAAEIANRRGALVDQVVFTQESDVGQVTGLIEAGSHHVFTQGITSTTVFQRIRDSLATAYDISYGTNAELTLNPVGPTFANGELNPFHVPEIREALNWLVDRNYIAEEIYGGLAVPRFLPLNTAFPDYARLADVARELELRYAHDPQRAREVIQREMQALGVRLVNGRWHHEGQPVRVIVLIRTEDERHRVGNYIANLMEDVGFTVERHYRTAEEASRIWIGGDPKAGRWHIYTGGWIAAAIQRDQAQNFSDFYTPRGRAEPLWQAYDPTPEFDELAERLQRRDYQSREERQDMMAHALALAMENSVRIWLVDQLNVSARSSNVQVATDLAGGLSGSILWPYTVRFKDRVGGEMVFGSPDLLTEPWNPIAGSNWIFDQMIIRSLQDPSLIPDPFTGLYWPQRIASAEVVVQKDVPVTRTLDWLSVKTAAEIKVPDEAWIDWDAKAGRFVTVGEKHEDGITARICVRIRYEEGYLERRWHDGSRVSLADVVLPWILTFARADPDSRLHDVAHLPVFEAFQRHFRGWHIASTEPLVIEIYSDQIYPDAETIVAAWAPNTTPWHVLSLGILAERNGELAFSSNKADRQRVDWMSLVAGPSIPVLERHLQRAREQGFVPYPAVLKELIREGEATERYRALSDWHRQRNHFWVGDGPFYLHSVHPVAGSVVLRRYEDFPDPADKWLRFTEPEIPELDLDGPMVVESGEGATFSLAITFEGEPYARKAIEQAQFLLFDGRGELARKGNAKALGNGHWQVSLPPETVAKLGHGANSLELAVTSRRVALPSFASHVFATVPEGGWRNSP